LICHKKARKSAKREGVRHVQAQPHPFFILYPFVTALLAELPSYEPAE
jgi:hypothetical protein